MEIFLTKCDVDKKLDDYHMETEKKIHKYFSLSVKTLLRRSEMPRGILTLLFDLRRINNILNLIKKLGGFPKSEWDEIINIFNFSEKTSFLESF